MAPRVSLANASEFSESVAQEIA